jgi:hypothetical protein
MSDKFDADPLPDAVIVYRAIRSNSWIHPDTGEVLALAYYLKPDEVGISVGYNCTTEEVKTAQNTCFGVAELEVMSIRRADNRLNVIPDTQTHAEIIGVPHKEDDSDLADYFADLLAALSGIVWRGKYVAPKK